MNKRFLKPSILIGCLLAATIAIMSYNSNAIQANPNPGPAPAPVAPGPDVTTKHGIVTFTGGLSQTKIYTGGDGTFSMALTLAADEIAQPGDAPLRNVDLVIVLDRSGSMEGQKIQDAKRAVINLLPNLSPKDRLALVSYSDGVTRHTGLLPMTEDNRRTFEGIVNNIREGGGTNLGAGLQTGLAVLTDAERSGNIGKVILISDGLANQGIVDPESLGQIAASAVRNEFAVSTVGVGYDFNEFLMTTLADRGTGQYHFLENPAAFAEVFLKEFQSTRAVAATGVEVIVPLTGGFQLVDAAGYPIERRSDGAVFRPGDLLSGQTRKIYITLRVPSLEEKTYTIPSPSVRYRYNNENFSVSLPGEFRIACVKDKVDAYASMDKETWEKKVVQEDFGKLREEVSRSLGAGRKEEALAKIQAYEAEQSAINSVVQSEEVTDNLDKDVGQLKGMVEDTFTGGADEVQMKQKANSKTMQFDSYKQRRALK